MPLIRNRLKVKVSFLPSTEGLLKVGDPCMADGVNTVREWGMMTVAREAKETAQVEREVVRVEREWAIEGEWGTGCIMVVGKVDRRNAHNREQP